MCWGGGSRTALGDSGIGGFYNLFACVCYLFTFDRGGRTY